MIVVCQKWITRDAEPSIERGGSGTDGRFGGISPADSSALEWGLRLGTLRSEPVTVITYGPTESEKALREAAAAGADHLVRIDGPTRTDSIVVAREIAGQCGDDVSFLWCGDYSLDRGTGSVPAFLAGLLEMPMAFGIVGVELGAGDPLEVLRRLDGGRRERLRLDGRGVISVEGSTATLRRAPLSRVLSARSRPLDVFAPRFAGAPEQASSVSPYRPRARQLPPPAGDTPLARLHALTSSGARSARGETVTLEPGVAAKRILDTLATWGYTIPPAPMALAGSPATQADLVTDQPASGTAISPPMPSTGT